MQNDAALGIRCGFWSPPAANLSPDRYWQLADSVFDVEFYWIFVDRELTTES